MSDGVFVVGTGAVGGSLAATLAERGQSLVGVCDVDASRARAIGSIVRKPAFFGPVPEDANLADLSRHYCPSLLAEDLNKLDHDVTINISHLKPGYEDVIMRQCREAVPGRVFNRLHSNDHFEL